ncbi:MAG: 1-acyl-sn-glycerol-3-phosphate acyltransferase [Planctomycetales bacterium]|nr:1-acyl-sn-glycerol-3-phosphate acyltransferase [Planctomycetales bacterium]
MSQMRFAWRILAFCGATVGFLTLLELESLVRGRKRRRELVNKWTSRWAATALRVFGVRLDAQGPFFEEGRLYPGHTDAGVGRVFVSNHQSGMDIPVLLSLVAGHAISRHDLANWPIVGFASRRVGTLFVDRTSRRSGANVLQEIDKALDVGEGVVMFPEGTVFVGDEVHPFRTGAFKAAQRADAEVVPIGIAYGDAGNAFEAPTFFEHMKRIGSLRSLQIAVEAGEPFVANSADAIAVKDALHDQVQQLVLSSRGRLETPETR